MLREILGSSLAARHDLRVVVTHRAGGALRRHGAFARALPALAAFCAGRGPRLLHVHMTVRGSMDRKAVLVLAARALRRPVLLHVHSGPGDLHAYSGRIGAARRRLYARALRAADRVVSVSEASAVVLRERFGANTVEVLPNAFPAAPASGRGADPAGPGQLRVLYVGGFANPVKGGAVLLEALPRLQQAHPGAAVTLAGPGEPANGAVTAAGARWAGWLDPEAKRRELDAADVFVLPSTSEGLPVALLEAMAHGKAVVATTVGGVPDVVADGGDGVLVPPGDPGVLAEALVALAGDPERVRRLGRAAAERARRRGPEDLADDLDRIYRELTAR